MKVIQSPSFRRKIKKLDKSLKLSLDDQVKKIMQQPNIGKEKKGDLQGVRVYKFKFDEKQYLLSYRILDEIIQFLTFGSHQNYYRDLKKSI